MTNIERAMENYNNHIISKLCLHQCLMLALLVGAMATCFAQTKPTIGGAVFGGGRMADVTGNTVVNVYESNAIGSIYGGNDIAGSVNGATGATITIGSTNSTEAIIIGSVYGGGNGFYNYQYIGGTTDEFVEGPSQPSQFTGHVYLRGLTSSPVATFTDATYIPSILASSITINSSGTKIDSVFGGAKNARVTSTGTCADITINGGTIRSVFGGNNYGGSIGDTANHTGSINIAVTSTTTNADATYAEQLGIHHGIRTLFGGGNKVAISIANISIAGGQIDTVFAGGNSATVASSTNVTVNVNSPVHTDYSSSYVTFDVRCLFGGNNLADMYILPTLNFDKGCIQTVYGGGNMGGMTANYSAAVEHLGNHVRKSTFVQVASTSDIIINNLYGGCMMADVSHCTFINIRGGQMGVVYGGCNVSGLVADSSYVYLKGGTIHDYVFGGSNGDYGCNDGVLYTSGNYSGIAIPDIINTYVCMDSSAVVEGNLYGGGNKAPVGSLAGRIGSYPHDGIASVMLISGTVNGTVFGGGRMASIYGHTHLNVNGTITINKIYGTNDISGNVSGQNRLSTDVALDGTVLANQNGAYMRIQGNPTIGSVFGGGNGDYTENYYTSVFSVCTSQTVDELRPHQDAAYVDIDMGTEGKIAHVYGGGNFARVQKVKTYIIGAGTIDTVFGGGNCATVTDTVALIVNATTVANSPNYNVKTLFGGNNAADMAIVPNVVLTKGRFHTIYGGGNVGGMTANKYFIEAPHLSTFVHINTSNVDIAYSVYGGCRMADVAHGTFVKVTNGSVNKLFGGNDVSGIVEGQTHILVEGGSVTQLYGGSNGHYMYNSTSVKNLVGDTTIITTTSALSRPLCDTTNVQLSAGNVIGNIYGGGLAGDCNYTNVNIEGTCKVDGTIFGGGCGEVANVGKCNTVNYGNVTKLAITDIRSMASNSESKIIYGGGNAGNVANTDLTLYGTLVHQFDFLFGGCNAADVSGIAKTNIQGSTTADTTQYFTTVDTVYGGNNYAGTVDSVWLTVKSGRYYNIYGGGNGDYKYYLQPNKCDSVPFNNVIRVDLGDSTSINDNLLTIMGNVYGGGNKGVVGKDLNTNEQSGYHIVTDGEYGQIVTNIYSGYYRNHVFAGARGREAKTDTIYGHHQLVFGIKEVNMYDGYIHHSLYGGSEYIDDGYPWECTGVSTTTLRPSSIMNIMGGTVNKHVYGAGYLGTVYGSVYVNVGIHAVDSCVAFRRTYSGTTTSYAALKPSRAIRDNLYLRASVYNGSDWGDAGANSVFNTRGFYGGESQIIVDGNGYNTSASLAGSSLKALDIEFSLIGSGTSCEGGDVNRRIIVRNYGDYTSCNVSKELYSIQRADTVLVEHSYFTLLGEQDAYSSYPSPDYSFNRIGLLIFRDKNIVMIEAPALKIGEMRSENADGTLDEVPGIMASIVTTAGCSSTATLCQKITTAMLDYNILMMNNGVYCSLQANDMYGAMLGYMYLLAQDGTMSYVYARYKNYGNGTNAVNGSDGGFISVCSTDNVDSTQNVQLAYVNSGTNYRTWTVGTEQGSRTRHITIVANANPFAMSPNNQYLDTNKTVVSGVQYRDLAVAHSALELPPANGGSYYKVSSVVIDQDNGGQIQLVAAAWDGDSASGKFLAFSTPDSIARRAAALTTITSDPNYSFGLMFRTGNNFATPGTADYCSGTLQEGEVCADRTVVMGNSNYELMEGFVSNTVAAGTSVLPTINFDLLYSTDFNTTVIRDIIFSVNEYNSNGVLVGPITVTVTVATVISDFADIDLTMLAMYNEGTSNEYVRKVILPAAFERRLVKLVGIEWNQNAGAGNGEMFKVVDKTTGVGINPDVFAFSVNMTENVTDNIANTLGWYDIATSVIDVHSQAGATIGDTLARYTSSTFDKTIGTLDGRASAAMDVTLHFNGDIYYQDYARVGTVKLKFAYNTDRKVTYKYFYVTLNVKTRNHGDTIYLASDSANVRLPGMENAGEPALHACTTRQLTSNMTSTYYREGDGSYAVWKPGKSPDYYVTSFTDALSKEVYIEGDVICIIGPVRLENTDNLVLRGTDYSVLQVIRYSGSHKLVARGQQNAYLGPMVTVKDQSQLSLYNMWFNGSGLTKTQQSAGASLGTYSFVVDSDHSPILNYKDTLFAQGPVFSVKDKGKVTLCSRVKISNNFNKVVPNNHNTVPGTNYYPGGAIGVYKTPGSIFTPTVILGNTTEIFNNIVVDSTNGHYNHGGAVYVCDGSFQLGVLTKGGDVIKLTNNYVVPGTITSGNLSVANVFRDTTRYTGGHNVDYFTMDTLSSNLSHYDMFRSNVFLTRTPDTSSNAIAQQMYDTKSDIITFNNELGADTRIGVSKWFPGPTCRDTISIARVAGTKQLYAATAYNNKNFVDDSSSAYIFYHSTVSPYTIYFQRCATFKQRQESGNTLVTNDEPFTYHINPESRCSAMLDSLQYKLQGGFYPYTYTWQCTQKTSNLANVNWSTVASIRTRTSPYDNLISNTSVAENATLRELSSVDTCVLVNLAMHPSEDALTYVYRVVGNDLTGNCPMSQEVDIRVVRTADNPYTVDTDASWLGKTSININNPGVDGNLTANIGIRNAANTADSTRARFVRVCTGVTFNVFMLPSSAYGSLVTYASDGTILTDLEDLKFCPGDILTLNTYKDSINEPGKYGLFVMWDYDPQATSTDAVYTIPSVNSEVTAIYRPSRYWYHHVTTKPEGYVVDYDGNVTISSAEGLAWLISTTNGLNNQVPQQFHNKQITITNISGGYDMSAYLWTPLGNINNPFSGTFNGGGATISGIVVNEPNIPYVGFFGGTEGAAISNINLTEEVLNGNNYVGGLVAMATNGTSINACTIANSAPISGSYCVGALVGSANNRVTINDCTIGGNSSDKTVNLLGNAVYAGGVCGYVTAPATIKNTNIYINTTKLQSALYEAGVAGNSMNAKGSGGKSRWWKRDAKVNDVTEIKNNYINITTSGRGMRAGGLVGNVSDAELVNNYAYGEVLASNRAGGIAASVGNNVTIDRCFYVQGTAEDAFGSTGINKSGITNVSSFTGSGNQCVTQTPVEGINNVTRILNTWVWAEGDSSEYKTWRSDLLRKNTGYPIFGSPDIIPVVDTTYNSDCDTITWNGTAYTSDTVFHVNVVDSTLFIDSTMTFVFTVNHSQYAVYFDSVQGGEYYNGHGFNFTAEDLARLCGNEHRQDVCTFQFVDSLLTANGCDSVVVLNLTVYVKQGIEEVERFNIDVYPNPTRNSITVTASGLESVEVYDALSRLITKCQVTEGSCQFDFSRYSSGIYYLRVHTSQGVAVRKVIKK